MDRTVKSAHAVSIAVHCPGIDDMSMAVREALAELRDAAGAAQYRATDSAAVLLAEINRAAASAVYAPLATSKLIRLRCALALTLEAARALEWAARK